VSALRAWELLGAALVAIALLGATDEGGTIAEQRPAVPSDLATEALLLDAAWAGERIVAVGTWGHVVLSDDGGETWRQARHVPSQALLTGLYFADARRGWAVGHDAVVVHTLDGGETWSLQHAAPEAESPLFSVWFRDARHGIAVGAFGLALETRDGGGHWERVAVVGEEEIALHLNEVFADGRGRLFIAAESGVVYRSRPGEDGWTRIQTPYDGSLWGGLALGDTSLLVFGMRGHVLRSVDGGETWREAPSGTDHSLGGGARLDEESVVLVGLGGAVTLSRDGGQTFQAFIRPDRRGANAVLPLDEDRLLVLGEGGLETVVLPDPEGGRMGDRTPRGR
jgi:photosystem II stability/assembly factor-like uncharacterized protein